MSKTKLGITYIGGPTALLEFAGVRLLTDPTFDPPGGEYTTGPVTLHKSTGPALPAEALQFDVVLLSHDHHFDNLDHLGRDALRRADKVVTTREGAARLGGNAAGIAVGEVLEVVSREGRRVWVTGTPARHGPAGHDRGPVTGFVLEAQDDAESAVYVSGDTVWYEGVAELHGRFPIDRAILFMGAARVPEVGPWSLTMSAADGVQFALAFPEAAIIPLHFEGWRHFRESQREIAEAFRAAGIEERLHWLPAGRAVEF